MQKAIFLNKVFCGFLTFILRERERERERENKQERGRERGDRKPQAGSTLSAQSPMQGSVSQTVRL